MPNRGGQRDKGEQEQPSEPGDEPIPQHVRETLSSTLVYFVLGSSFKKSTVLQNFAKQHVDLRRS
jgi:hypothetical protein